jgi:hypothetical protein
MLWMTIVLPPLLVANAGVTASVPTTNTAAASSANIPMVLFIIESSNSLTYKYIYR